MSNTGILSQGLQHARRYRCLGSQARGAAGKLSLRDLDRPQLCCNQLTSWETGTTEPRSTTLFSMQQQAASGATSQLAYDTNQKYISCDKASTEYPPMGLVSSHSCTQLKAAALADHCWLPLQSSLHCWLRGCWLLRYRPASTRLRRSASTTFSWQRRYLS